MIKNERQYTITKSQIHSFEAALKDLRTKISQGDSSELSKIQQSALKSQLAELKEEVSEYESLLKHPITSPAVSSVTEIPQLLIRARISKGLTQRELGERLGLKEQQIQRYEASDYNSASLARIIEIAKALGLQMPEPGFSHFPSLNYPNFLARLRDIGLEPEFVMNRFFPPEFNLGKPNDFLGLDTLLASCAEKLCRVFSWTMSDFLGGGNLSLSPQFGAIPNFKLPKKVNKKKLAAYVLYAQYMVTLLLQCTKDLVSQPLSDDPESFLKSFRATFPTITMRSLLEFAWSNGIVILPLSDPGGFHGACWRIEGRNVIVLKQRTASAARWIFDFLHELWHTTQEPKATNRSKITIDFDSTTDLTEEEQLANQFAGDVMLNLQTEELANECAKESARNIPHLKQAVIRVSKKHGIPQDFLANYLAYRLSTEGQNWWPTAQSLRVEAPDSLVVAKEFLLEKVSFSSLTHVDKDLIIRALS